MVCNLKRYCSVVVMMIATTLYGMEENDKLQKETSNHTKKRNWHKYMKGERKPVGKVKQAKENPEEQAEELPSRTSSKTLEKIRELQSLIANYKRGEKVRSISSAMLEEFLEGLQAYQKAKQEEESKNLLGDIAFLLERHPDLLKDKASGWYPLHRAVLLHVPQALQLFLDRGGNAMINEIDEQGQTALYLATCAHNWESVNILLEKGADPDIVPAGKGLPFMLPKRVDSVRTLLDSEIKNKNSTSPAYLNNIQVKYPSIFNLLYPEGLPKEIKQNPVSHQEPQAQPQKIAQMVKPAHRPKDSKVKQDSASWYKKVLLAGIGVSFVGYILYKFWYNKSATMQEKAA
jgi:hypothetical protein